MRTVILLCLAVVTLGDGSVPAGLAQKLSSPKAETRLGAVRDLAQVPGKEASRLLAEALGDRSSKVREAVLDALGGRKDPIALNALEEALRIFKQNKDLLPVAVTAVGASEDLSAAGKVAAIAGRAVGSDARLTRACIDTLGRLRSSASVAGLMDLLAVAEDTRRAGHPEYAGDVLDSLRSATGLPFTKADTWRKWWRHAKGAYEPERTARKKDESLFRSDAWLFTLALPKSGAWRFEHPKGVLVRAAFTGPKKEALFAIVDVTAHAVSEGAPKTAAAAAADYAKWMKKDLHDVQDAAFGEKGRLGNRPAVVDRAVGIFANGAIARWKVYFTFAGGILYTVGVQVETGASKAVRKDVESIATSFRYVGRR